MAAEKLADFHNSRVVWTIYKGKMYFALSEKGHKKWFMDTLCIPEDEMETVKRGYIRRSNEDWDVLNIVAYKGSNFEPVELTEEETTRLLWMADLIHECEKIKVYTGVQIGEVGEVWKPINLIKSVDSVEDDCKHKTVSLKALIDYEDMLIDFLEYHNINDALESLVASEKEIIIRYIKDYIENVGDITLCNATDRAAGYRIK